MRSPVGDVSVNGKRKPAICQRATRECETSAQGKGRLECRTVGIIQCEIVQGRNTAREVYSGTRTRNNNRGCAARAKVRWCASNCVLKGKRIGSDGERARRERERAGDGSTARQRSVLHVIKLQIAVGSRPRKRM